MVKETRDSIHREKILIVDDEPDVTELLAFNLTTQGYAVRTLNQPLEFTTSLREFKPDLLILDVMMPGLNGIQLCRIVRADNQTKDLPIIFLSARGEAEDRIEGLESGADDYISKPFNTKELLLRIKKALKRRIVAKSTDSMGSIRIAGVELDEAQHQLSVDGEIVPLTLTEFKLLKLLMERKGRVQNREHLLANVWQYDTDIETRTVDTHVRRVRDKLGPYANIIETIRGVGYRAVDPRKPV